MASKEITFSDNARNKLYEGIKQLNNAVKVKKLRRTCDYKRRR